jgi:hypothetical protein
MPQILKVRYPRFNRRKIFETEDLRLWVRPEGRWSGPVARARLELERCYPRRESSKWRIVWSGSIIITEGGVDVEGTRPVGKGQNSKSQ